MPMQECRAGKIWENSAARFSDELQDPSSTRVDGHQCSLALAPGSKMLKNWRARGYLARRGVAIIGRGRLRDRRHSLCRWRNDTLSWLRDRRLMRALTWRDSTDAFWSDTHCLR
jgi:hypothetical protein